MPQWYDIFIFFIICTIVVFTTIAFNLTEFVIYFRKKVQSKLPWFIFFFTSYLDGDTHTIGNVFPRVSQWQIRITVFTHTYCFKFMNINNAPQQTEESSEQEAITWAIPFFLSVALDVNFTSLKLYVFTVCEDFGTYLKTTSLSMLRVSFIIAVSTWFSISKYVMIRSIEDSDIWTGRGNMWWLSHLVCGFF